VLFNLALEPVDVLARAPTAWHAPTAGGFSCRDRWAALDPSLRSWFGLVLPPHPDARLARADAEEASSAFLQNLDLHLIPASAQAAERRLDSFIHGLSRGFD